MRMDYEAVRAVQMRGVGPLGLSICMSGNVHGG